MKKSPTSHPHLQSRGAPASHDYFPLVSHVCCSRHPADIFILLPGVPRIFHTILPPCISRILSRYPAMVASRYLTVTPPPPTGIPRLLSPVSHNGCLPVFHGYPSPTGIPRLLSPVSHGYCSRYPTLVASRYPTVIFPVIPDLLPPRVSRLFPLGVPRVWPTTRTRK